MATLLPGLCSVTFRHLRPRAIVELAGAAGLAAIEWGGDIHLPPGNLVRASQLRRATEVAGIKPASYGTYLRPPQHSMDETLAIIETALMVGATNIRIWPGFHRRRSADYTPGERVLAANGIREIAELAGDRGVTVSLEYHPGTLTDDLASAERLIEAVDHPNLFTYWQPRPGLPIDTALQEIGGLRRQISHLHVFAWDEDGTRLPLSAGSAYWARVFEAVGESRWTGERYAMIEFVRDDSLAQFRDDAATLQELLRAG